jgi:hypothetical protein
MDPSFVLTDSGCDRATAYHMSNKVVRHRDGVFVTWLDENYRAIVANIDPDRGQVLAAFPLHQGYDNHCGAALAVTPDQRLHVVAGSHHSGFIYRHSDTPADPGSWSLPESVGSASTYPSLVALADGGLVLAYRRSSVNGRWSAALQRRSPKGRWSGPTQVMIASAERYTYPTNSLVVDAQGILHLGLEFYKTYKSSEDAARSVAVTHAYSEDAGITWHHDDGRKVHTLPFGMEDSYLVDHDVTGNLRPGNLAVLPDGRVVMAVWNARLGTLTAHVRQNPGSWESLDLTAAATGDRDGWRVNSQGRVAVDQNGQLVIVTTTAPEMVWGHPRQHLQCLWVEPDSLTVTRSHLVPKEDPGRAAWLASVEHGHTGQAEHPLLVLYSDGNRGETCINDARCRVRMLQLPPDAE